MSFNIIKPADIQKSIATGAWNPNIYLTNVAVAQFQKPGDFVAKKLFPMVPVTLPTSKFYKFDKGDLARIAMQEKPAFGSVTPTVWGQSDESYDAKVYQAIYGVDLINALVYERSGAPGVANPQRAKALVAAEQSNLFMDFHFAKNYFQRDIWSTEMEGVTTTPTSGQFYQFDNDNSDPIKFFADLRTQMKREGRRSPNKLGLGAEAFDGLCNNPAVVERVKYTGSSANPAKVTENVLAQLFQLDEVAVLESTYNSAPQGAETNMEYICDPKSALLCYTTNAPAIDEPSAGYTFTWDPLGNGNPLAITNYLGAHATHSEYVEALTSFDMKVVSSDLAVFLYNCVS